MDFSPLLSAPLTDQLHVAAALTALLVTPIMLMRRKGDKLHKILGRVWVLAMALTAISSFAIHDIRLVGPFSPIHLLSCFTLYTLYGAISMVRVGRIEAHKQHMIGAMGGLLGAGLFTLLPGRLMSQVVFRDIQVEGFIGTMIASGLVIVAWRLSVKGNTRGTA